MLMLAVFGHINSLGKDSSLLLISTGGVKLIQFKFYKNTRHLQISKVNVSFNSILSNNAWIDIVLIRVRIIYMNMKYCWQHGKPFLKGGGGQFVTLFTSELCSSITLEKYIIFLALCLLKKNGGINFVVGVNSYKFFQCSSNESVIYFN